MLNNLRIGTRIILGFTLVLVLGVSMLIPMFLADMDELTVGVERRELERLHETALAELTAQQQMAVNLSHLVAQLPVVQQAFAHQDRAYLQTLLLPVFATLKDTLDIRQFQIHTPPATSFLRLHKPEKFGDDLSSFRATVVATNTQKVAISGIEKGVAGLGIRGVVPIFWQQTHLGSVEFGLALGQPFAKAFKEKHHVDLAIYLPEGAGFRTFASSRGQQSTSFLSQEQLKVAFNGQAVKQRHQQDGGHWATYANVLTDYSGKSLGIIEITMDRSHYVEVMEKSLRQALMTAALTLVIGVVIAILITRSILQPLYQLRDLMHNIAEGDGDLTVKLPEQGNNEFTEVAASFNRFTEHVEKIVREIMRSLATLAEGGARMYQVTEHTNGIIQLRRQNTAEVAAAMHQMNATAQEVASHAAATAQSTDQADEHAGTGLRVVTDSTHAIRSLAEEVEQAVTVIRKLDEYSENIGTILDVIRGIAEQTNLLALNAAIEAARAGEQGRGFAVVADEVRQLAQRSQESTNEIQSMISQLQQGAEDAVSVIEHSRTRAVDSVAMTQAASEALNSIVAAVQRINDMSAQIASAAEEQTSVSEEINRHMIHISQVAEETSQGSAQITGATSEIGTEVATLMKTLRRFRIHVDHGVEIAMAKSAHQAWIIRLRAFLDGEGNLSEQQAMSHHECDLGRWYDGIGLENYGHLPAMRALKDPHKRMHQLIKEIIHAKHTQDPTRAEDLYQQVGKLSKEIIRLLDEIENQLGKP